VPSISGKTIGTTANTSSSAINLWVSSGTDFNSRTGSLGIQSNTFDIWGVQAEAGSVATAFQTATGTIQGELAACQRYYYAHESSGTVNTSVGAGGYYSSSNYLIPISFPVTMRTSPTFASSTVTNGWNILTNGGLDGINLLIQESANTRVAQCYNNAQASGTAGYYGQLTSQSASTSLAWSAEL
jgi:hypothetical protein